MNIERLIIFICFFSVLIFGCNNGTGTTIHEKNGISIVVLGIAQDAGFPQANCQKDCCKEVWKDSTKRKMVSCLAILDYDSKKYWLFDATPDFKDQLAMAQNLLGSTSLPEGIFLTHAHIGHYTGLMHLGREVIGSRNTKVYAMPRMKSYLEKNGPWSQLVDLENIDIQPLKNEIAIQLSESLTVTPILVPHRDEFSETVGYEISGPTKTTLFIPDINKWELWEKDIVSYIENVDYAFLDGSFYENGEIPGRDMSEIPHPFLVESMALFDDFSSLDKAKIKFIHFNHTNPVLDVGSEAYRVVTDSGFGVSEEGGEVGL